MYQSCENICILIGLTFVLFQLKELFYRLVVVFPENRFKRYGGGWAVITGGSDGIGLEFCNELAKDGFNVCIIGRNKQKIGRVCDRLQGQYKVETKMVIKDFKNCSESSPQFFNDIMKQIGGIDISILVNNVGIMLDPQAYIAHSGEQIKEEISVNIFPITFLTRSMIPLMKKRYHQTGNRSLIINLSSFIADFPSKNAANYSSTKIFDHFISQAVAYENPNSIDFLSLKPALVTTPLTRNTSSIMHVTPTQCVKGALKCVGRRTVSYGHWWHQFQSYLAMLFHPEARNQIVSASQTKMGQLYKAIDKSNSRR